MIFEKFIRSYIEFINEHFNIKEHHFFVIGKDYGRYNLDGLPHTTIVDKAASVLTFNARLYSADKVILHGLWNPKVIRLLNLQPWLVSKCYWMMWGGDFYNYQQEPLAKKKLIKRIRHFITFVKGDFEFVQKHYGAHGSLHECVMYPVSFYEDFYEEQKIRGNETINILVGNSADPSNNHSEIFKYLQKYKEERIIIYVPLSYGNPIYATEVEALGKSIFGEKLIVLKDIMPLVSYKKFLKTIDIGVFYHNRQQGTGNMIPLIINGSKVFLRPGVTTWQLFTDLGVKVYDMKEFDLVPLSVEEIQKNQESMKHFFSRENYIQRLKLIFNS